MADGAKGERMGRQRLDADGDVIEADRRKAKVHGAWVRWNGFLERDFLARLSATGNVSEACAAIGLNRECVYRRRLHNAAFAAAWLEALALGYVMLETHLLAAAMAPGAVDANGRKALPDGGAVDVPLALQLLTRHRDALKGAPRAQRGGPPVRRHTIEEIDAALLKAIAGRSRKEIVDVSVPVGDTGVPALPEPVVEA